LAKAVSLYRLIESIDSGKALDAKQAKEEPAGEKISKNKPKKNTGKGKVQIIDF